MTAHRADVGTDDRAPFRRTDKGGHGCADPDTLRPHRPRIRVAAINAWTAQQEATRDAYEQRKYEVDRDWRRCN